MNKIKESSIKLLRTGLSPSRVAAALSMGIAIGVFPILGPFSIFCGALALLFRLNVPIALAGYYAMTLVQPLFIIPYLRAGEFIFQSEPMLISLTDLTLRFTEDAHGTLLDFGWSFIHAAVGWVVLLPVIFSLLYPVSLAVVTNWNRNMSHRMALILAICLSHLSLSFSSEAGIFSSSSKQDQFPTFIYADNSKLELSGTGTLKYKGIVPVYDAALYTSTNGAKRLDVVYRVSAKASEFIDAGDRILSRNHDAARMHLMQDNLNKINEWYPDAKKGDTCSITHTPGKGIELTYNGESRGIINNDAFARYYFSIWLGDKPASKKLKDDLLPNQKL